MPFALIHAEGQVAERGHDDVARPRQVEAMGSSKRSARCRRGQAEHEPPAQVLDLCDARGAFLFHPIRRPPLRARNPSAWCKTPHRTIHEQKNG